MASQQDPRVKDNVRGKELRAEEAARTAADELHDVNKQRASGAGEVSVEHRETRTDANRPGILGSLFQSVTGTLGNAKDVVTGKTHEGTEKANIVSREAAEREAENRDAAMRKAGEYKDYTARKAGEAADKTGEYKDYTAQKTRETADSAAQKTKDAKDATMGKMGEYKDYTADKAREAKDYTADKAKGAKDYTVDKAKEAKDYTADMAKGAADKAREAKDYTAEKAKDAKDYTVDKSKEGKENTVGALTGLKDKAMDFFTGKKDETKERMSERGDFPQGAYHETEEEAKRKLETMRLKDQGYEARGTRMDAATGGTTIAQVDRLKDTAEAFRKSDQMSGQSFNDVGGLNDYDGKGERGGVYRVELKHEKK